MPWGEIDHNAKASPAPALGGEPDQGSETHPSASPQERGIRHLLSMLWESQDAFHDYLFGYTPSGDEKAVRLFNEIEETLRSFAEGGIVIAPPRGYHRGDHPHYFDALRRGIDPHQSDEST